MLLSRGKDAVEIKNAAPESEGVQSERTESVDGITLLGWQALPDVAQRRAQPFGRLQTAGHNVF